MPKASETDAIRKCLSGIEAKLSWGNSEAWSNYDFEKLSEDIFDKTRVRLSTTTLKRVWGRIKYDHAPNTGTLNTLAQFAGYGDWRSFVQNNTGISPVAKDDVSDVEKTGVPKSKKSARLLLVWAFSGVFLFSITGYFFYQKVFGSVAAEPSNFSFKADKVLTEGVPNSVVFTYDASNAKTDSVFIVQTWDIRRRTLVPKKQTKHSAIYYYPGYFRTRLIVDGEVVKTHDLQISSDGWLGLIELETKPFYFAQKDIIKSDRVEIDEALLKTNHFDLKPVAPKIRFFNQTDFGDLMNDNFEFETVLRNNYQEGDNACQYVEVLIQCKDDIIIIPLVNRACVGDVKLHIPGKDFFSKFTDLTGFGADLSEWTTLRVTCKNRVMELFVNQKKAFEFTFPNQPTGIVGLQYRFNGVGEVKNTWFKNKENRIRKL